MPKELLKNWRQSMKFRNRVVASADSQRLERLKRELHDCNTALRAARAYVNMIVECHLTH